MQNFKPRALICALTAVGAFGAVSAGSVFAQAAPEKKTEKIEVTGSNIKRVDAESSAPIQVISQEEIRRSGKQTWFGFDRDAGVVERSPYRPLRFG